MSTTAAPVLDVAPSYILPTTAIPRPHATPSSPPVARVRPRRISDLVKWIPHKNVYWPALVYSSFDSVLDEDAPFPEGVLPVSAGSCSDDAVLGLEAGISETNRMKTALASMCWDRPLSDDEHLAFMLDGSDARIRTIVPVKSSEIVEFFKGYCTYISQKYLDSIQDADLRKLLSDSMRGLKCRLKAETEVFVSVPPKSKKRSMEGTAPPVPREIDAPAPLPPSSRDAVTDAVKERDSQETNSKKLKLAASPTETVPPVIDLPSTAASTTAKMKRERSISEADAATGADIPKLPVSKASKSQRRKSPSKSSPDPVRSSSRPSRTSPISSRPSRASTRGADARFGGQYPGRLAHLKRIGGLKIWNTLKQHGWFYEHGLPLDPPWIKVRPEGSYPKGTDGLDHFKTDEKLFEYLCSKVPNAIFDAKGNPLSLHWQRPEPPVAVEGPKIILPSSSSEGADDSWFLNPAAPPAHRRPTVAPATTATTSAALSAPALPPGAVTEHSGLDLTPPRAPVVVQVPSPAAPSAPRPMMQSTPPPAERAQEKARSEWTTAAAAAASSHTPVPPKSRERSMVGTASLVPREIDVPAPPPPPSSSAVVTDASKERVSHESASNSHVVGSLKSENILTHNEAMLTGRKKSNAHRIKDIAGDLNIKFDANWKFVEKVISLEENIFGEHQDGTLKMRIRKMEEEIF